ncbi:MAG: hypothetical protein AAGA86_03565 [Bacteroidota bacterium]
MIIHFLIVFLLLTSCSSDDSDMPLEESIDTPVSEDPILPEISLESGPETLFLGVIGGSVESQLNHTIKIEAPEGLASLTISRVRAGENEEYVTISNGHPDFSEGMTTLTYELDYVFDDKDVEQELYFLAEGVDKLGKTTSLVFANAWVKLPLLEASFTLHASKAQQFNPLLYHYLLIQGNSIKAVQRSEARQEENDKDIVAILSYNDDSEFYIASPTDINEGELTDPLLEISKTKFKYDRIAEDALKDTFSPMDVHSIQANYGDLLFAENEERLEKLKIGNRFYIETEDERIAILQVQDIESLGPTHTLVAFDILITQKL